MALASPSTRIGEIVEASTTGFTAESFVLHSAPPFGSLVRAGVGDLVVYGAVSYVKTESTDPGRRAIARGATEATEEDLYHNNPELEQLLRTEFTVLTLGFLEAGAVRQYLPPLPPHIHGFVFECDLAEVRLFSARLDFLPALLDAGQTGASDELVGAFLRLAGRAHSPNEGDRRGYLVSAGKELAMLLGSDVGRLNAILRRIRV